MGMTHLTPTAQKTVDMAGGWDGFWSALSEGMGEGFWNVLTVIGVLLVVASLLGYLWQHRRGTNWKGGTEALMGSLIIGAVLMAPNLLIPMILTVLDWIINFFISLLEGQGIDGIDE